MKKQNSFKSYLVRFVLALSLLLLGILSSNQLPAAAAQPAEPGDQPAKISERSVVNVHYADRAALQRAAAILDIWEVNQTEQTFVAMVSPEEYDWLLSQGYQVQVNEKLTAKLMAPPGYPCYRTIATLYTDLQQRAMAYPNLADLYDIGNTYEGRDLWVIRVTNETTGGAKPRFFLMANAHGREMITPETAMVYLDYLLQNYGTNADVTWLLNYHEIYIMPSANPDGHVKNESSAAYWRKNTHPYGSCSSSDIGVDLNRNYDFKWGLDDDGSSPYACDETYRGPSAASESETLAVQNYVRSLFPDQRGPNDTDAAPNNATGVLITLHSYSNLVLWPWGWTYSQAPNSVGLAALGNKFATYNGYNPGQSVGLYPTNGTTDDWSYGDLGIASYTFEMGTSSDDFFPSCSRYDALIQPNIPALVYAAKSARTPYMSSLGPDALTITTILNLSMSGESTTLQAVINDFNNGNQNVAAAVYSIDTSPWITPTLAHPMTASDGAFDENIEAVSAPLDTTGLAAGQHIVYVRGKDASGNWGPPSAIFIQVQVNLATLKGQVREAATADPIANAVVDLAGEGGPWQTTTDASGQYSLALTGGAYTATVSAFGYYSQTVSDIQLSNGITTTQNFTLTTVPTGTLTGFVHEWDTNLPLEATIRADGTPASTLSDALADGAFSLVLPVGTYNLTAHAAGHIDQTLSGIQIAQGTANPPVNFVLKKAPCPLLVDNDYSGLTNYNYETYYLLALQRSGFDYTYWDTKTQGYPSSATLNQYSTVIWLTGYAKLDSRNQTTLRTYLAANGRLLLSGQNIAQNILNGAGYFLYDILHVNFLGDHATPASVGGSGLYTGQSYALYGGDGANNQTSPDELQPLTGATPVFTYTASSAAAGVMIDDPAYRAIFLSYGAEAISTAEGRQAALDTGLNWLGCEPAQVDLSLSLDGPAGPLGYGDILTYTLTLTNASIVPLTELVVTDTLPAELEFISASEAGIFADGQVRWSDLNIPANSTLTLTITAKVKQGLAAGKWTIRNEDYAAQAVQMPAAVPGTTAVETELELVIITTPVYLPIVIGPMP